MKYILSMVFASLLFGGVKAQVPGTLSYQGILVTSAGAPAADGNHTVLFNFYKLSSGGVPIFARGPFTVITYKGMFTLLLGTGTPTIVNDPLPTLFSDPNYIGNTQYYVELVADNVILSPRVQLSSVPYAFNAQNANTMDAAGLTGTADLPNTVLDANLQDLADGSLSGSKVGAGISATNITTGTLSGSLVGTGVSAANITTSSLAIANGGTGASTALAARTGLGLVIGTDVQAFDADLSDLSDGSLSGSKVGPGIDASAITANTLSVLNGGTGASTVSAARTNLGLGSLSTLNAVSTTEITDGTITNIDISAGAGIADSKLATISTSGKVSGNAITSGTISGTTTFSVNTSGVTPLYAVTTGNGTAGVYGQSNGTGIGVYGYNNGGSGPGVYAQGTQAITANGAACGSGGWTVCSDIRFKQNIETLKNPLEKILKMRGVSYDLRFAEFPDKYFEKTRQLGLIAQEVKEILPEIVAEDKDGYYSITYDKVVPVLIEAIKEQQTQIEYLRSTNIQLKSQLSQLENLSAKVEELNKLVMGKEAGMTSRSKSNSTTANKGK